MRNISLAYLSHHRVDKKGGKEMKEPLEIRGVDELLRNLKHLEKHPEQLLAGSTFDIEQEVECDKCGFKQKVNIPVKIERIDGRKGYGPGGAITVICQNPDCGQPFEVTWDDVVFEIDLKY